MGSVLSGLDWSSIVSTGNEELLEQYLTGLIGTPGFLSSLGAGIVGFIIFVFIGVLVSLYLSIGQFGMAYESLRRRTRIGTMFKVSRKFGLRWIGATLLLIGFGLLALIPLAIIAIFTLGIGLIVALILIIPIVSLVAPAMLVDNASPIDSIKKAFKTAKRNYGNLLVLWLIFFGISFGASFVGGLLSFVPVIGDLINLFINLVLWLVLTPMIKISLVEFYLKNKRGS